MRAAALVPALLLALLAQPAVGQLPGVEACLAGQASVGAAPPVPARDADPLVRFESLFLGPDGTLVTAAEAGVDARVAAPNAVPLALDGTVVWARDVTHAATLRGDAALLLRLRVCLPALSATAASLQVALLVNGQDAARVDAGAQVLAPGDVELPVALPADGLALAPGDNLALAVTLHALNLEAVPSVSYVAGANGSRVDATLRYASLDALSHEHAPGDQHALLAEVRPQLGDLGGGRWGAAVELDPAAASPADIEVPANASRVLLQVQLEDGPGAPESVRVEMPGGPTTIHRGEVVAREIPRNPGGTLRCSDCGPGGRLVVLAAIRDVQPPPTAPGDPVDPGERGLEQFATDPSLGPRIGVDAAAERQEDALWYLVLLAPAAVMLVASIAHVMRGGGAWGEPPVGAQASAPARASARASGRR